MTEGPRIEACPFCAAPLPPEAISTELNAARCRSCGGLIDLAVTVSRIREGLTTPAGWEVDVQPGSTRIQFRWFSRAAVLLVAFTMLWNGLMLSSAWRTTGGFTQPEKLLSALLTPPDVIGLALIYVCVAMLINRTTIRLEHGSLTVRVGPLWWPGRRTLDASDIRELYVLEHHGNRGVRSYRLFASRRGKPDVRVLTFNEAKEARFVELRLEQSLGIGHRPVLGEYVG